MYSVRRHGSMLLTEPIPEQVHAYELPSKWNVMKFIVFIYIPVAMRSGLLSNRFLLCAIFLAIFFIRFFPFELECD